MESTNNDISSSTSVLTPATTIPIYKNDSRLASLMGPWTGLTNIETDVGGYSLQADYILHIVCDPMRVNTCEKPSCSEMDNQICAKPLNDNSKSADSCYSMENIVSDWSDGKLSLSQSYVSG